MKANEKWGDYCITEARFDRKRIVEEVRAHEDAGRALLKERRVLKRDEVIKLIEEGKSFVTVFMGATGWQRGESVNVIVVNGAKFLKTSGDENRGDDLGNVCEY